MSKTFSGLLSSFLLTYLPRTRGCSTNTVSTYRDAFVLFFRFMASERDVLPDAVGLDDLSKSNVVAFLEWLEISRGSGVNSCNNRLAVLKSFSRFVQLEAPEWIDKVKTVSDIKAKKTAQPEIAYLSVKAIELLLKEALASGGIRDAALLSLLYDTGARVQEVADIVISDIQLEKPSTVKLTGKGKKTRIVPLTQQAVPILKKHLAMLKPLFGDNHLFLNWKGEPIGRAGIAYILNKHTTAVNNAHPDIMPPKTTPHMLRHSKSMHLLENGVNLIYIRDLLGHESVITTEVYAKANPEVKRKAIETNSATIMEESFFNKNTQTDLLDWLREMI